MTRIDCLGWYEHRGEHIVKNYGGWVISGDWNLYRTLAGAKNAIDKRHDGSHKAEPIITRKLTKDEFILLPMFSIDSWFIPQDQKWQRVCTIGWLFWFIRWFKDIK